MSHCTTADKVRVVKPYQAPGLFSDPVHDNRWGQSRGRDRLASQARTVPTDDADATRQGPGLGLCVLTLSFGGRDYRARG